MATKRKVDLNTELGGTGTVITGGIISDNDYNSDLTGINGIDIYDQMRKGDATVRATLLSMKLPIISSNWTVEPASEDEQDQEIAEFVDKNLFEDLDMSWPEFLRQALLYLDYGRMVFEKVYTTNVYGQIVLKKLAPRLPQTIYAWEADPGVPGIHQIMPTGGEAKIPMEKLLVLVNEKEGDNWEGISILRSAYKSWYMKDAFYKIDGIAHERQGVGIPYAVVPDGASATDQAEAEEWLKNLRANEQARLKYKKGWEFGFLDAKAGSNRQIMPAIAHHDRQISKNTLAQFLELGATSSGSRSLSEDQSELFLLSLKAVARYIADTITNQVIKQLVDMNFYVEKYPYLKFSNIDKTDVNMLSTALQRITQSGMLTYDPGLERHIRNEMGLPELPEDLKEEKPKEKSTPKPSEDESDDEKLSMTERETLTEKVMTMFEKVDHALTEGK